MRARLIFLAFAMALLNLVQPLSAQSTGTLSGRVTSSDGLPLPGATVVLTSSALQGSRTTVSGTTGDYVMPMLPPGTYTVTVEIGDFRTVRESVNIAGTQVAVLDVMMTPAATDEVTVYGEAEPFVRTAQVATNFKQDLMTTLASNRTVDAAMLMAPNVHATGPRGGMTISGSQSYENLVTLNGAVITENLRGTPFTLYIEDALQEITVSSAGISAEYGRFSGGVANAVTKSGGNMFDGSFRNSFANDGWRGLTPFETTQRINNPVFQPTCDSEAAQVPGAACQRLNKSVPTYEYTLGGPIQRDRLWFFTAGRLQNQESIRQTVSTQIPYVRANDEKRFEGKVSYTPQANHSIKGSYIQIAQTLKNNTGQNVMDLASLTDQGQPANLVSLHYAGVLKPNFFFEAQFSARNLTFTDVGATTKDRILGTMITDQSKSGAPRYWSPTFCSGSTCDGDEQRDNDDLLLKASYFLSDPAFGSHHMVFGYDRYQDRIWANTHATGSDYRILGTNSIYRDGVIYPVFNNGTTAATSTTIQYNPLTVLSDGSNLRTNSVFFNDTWRAGAKLTLNVGVRWDKNHSVDGGGHNVSNKSSFSPRLAATWDPTGEGVWAISGNYGRYVMALNSNLAASTTAAGNASTFRWLYRGPAINMDPSAPLVSTEAALQQVFSWFDANGGSSLPLIAASVPGVNMQIKSPLKSPYSDELAGGISRQIGARGTIRVDGLYRSFKNLYALRTDTTTGKVTDGFSTYDLGLIENSDLVHRKYAGMTTQGTYQFNAALSVGGNYTLSHAYGNLDGETANGPSGTQITSYPEYKDISWNSPDGDLLIDQRHRARFWGTYTLPMNSNHGSVALGLVQQFASGSPYGSLSAVNPSSFVTNPGYATPPAAVEYYYADRDAYRTEGTSRTDFSVNYNYRIRSASKVQPEIFFHGEVLNLFNQFQLCGCGGTVFNNGGTTDLSTINQAVVLGAAFNPFTTVPQEDVNWRKGPAFGTATGTLAYTTPRLFRFSFGVRF